MTRIIELAEMILHCVGMSSAEGRVKVVSSFHYIFKRKLNITG